MAQFAFLGTWEDSWRILDAILAHGGYSITPDIRYETPTPYMAVVLDDALRTMCRDRGTAYIWSDQYTAHPPTLVLVEEGKNTGKYFVDLSKGGPGVGMHFPPCYERDGIIKLAAGTIWTPSKTWDPVRRQWEPPSVELRRGFRRLIAIAKRQLTRLTGPIASWIGPEAKRLVEENLAQVQM